MERKKTDDRDEIDYKLHPVDAPRLCASLYRFYVCCYSNLGPWVLVRWSRRPNKGGYFFLSLYYHFPTRNTDMYVPVIESFIGVYNQFTTTTH